MKVLKDFERRFKDKDFMRPDILEISAVEIYVPDEKEQQKEKERRLLKKRNQQQKKL